MKHAGMSPVLVDYLSNLVRLPLTALLISAIGRREPLPLATTRSGCGGRRWSSARCRRLRT